MRKMTQGSIARHLIAYALPLILGNLFQLTYNAVDSIVIGKFAGENALAAVSAANPVMTIMILGVSGVSIGASVLMSRFYGAGDEDALRREVATTIVFGGVASVAAFLLGWPLSGPVLRLMRVPGEILAMATRYLQVIFVGFLFTFQYNILAAALRSVGDSKTPVIFLALASVMNAGLDVLLVAVFRWGVVGAGLATLISRSVGAYITQRALRDPHCRIPYPGMFPFEWHPSEVKKILSVGIPSGFENGLFQLGKLLLLRMIAGFGTISTAANTVGNTLGSFQCLPGNAIGLAMIAVVGQCCGAHAYDQAKFYTKKLMQIVYLCMGTLNILMLLCNPIITLPFNLSPEATVLARQIVALHGAGCVFLWPMSFTMPNALRAAGDAKYTMTVAVFSMAVFRIGFGVFLATTMGMGVIGVWIAMQIDWVFRIICFLIRWASGKWQTKTLV